MTDRSEPSSRSIRIPIGEAAWSPDGWSISVPYLLNFSRKAIKGEAYYVILSVNEGQRQPVFRFSWIRMGEDPYLLFPESARDSVQSGTKRQDGNQG